MGIESTSEDVLRQVCKGSTTRHDLLACRLLKDNGIISVIGHIVGLQDETPATFRAARRQLRFYDGDWLNAMYVTPHDWTPLGKQGLAGEVVEPDLSKWDYRHQVIGQRDMTPLRIFLHVKWMELCFHVRPGRLLRAVFDRDRLRRQEQRWVMLHIGGVWIMEIMDFTLTWIGRMRITAAKSGRAAAPSLAAHGQRRALQEGSLQLYSMARRGHRNGLINSIPSIARGAPMSSVYRRVAPAVWQAPRSMLSQCDRLKRSARLNAQSNDSAVGKTSGYRCRNA